MRIKKICFIGLTSTLITFGLPAFGDADLVQAIRVGNFDSAHSLLKGKVDINARHGDGSTALMWAVYHDNLDLIDTLLDRDADVGLASDLGVTALSLACENANSIVVGKLLRAGANPNQAEVTGVTPLMDCSRRGAVDAVKDLLAHGADPNAVEHRGEQTALMLAAVEQHPEVMRALIKGGANVAARSKIIPEPEPFIIEIPNEELGMLCCTVFGSNYPPTIRFPEITGGFTALHFAAQQGDLESAGILLEAGADIDSPHQENGTPLVLATASGHEDLALFFLEQGADPNVKDGWGMTPLHYALHKGVLVLNNFKPSDTDHYGWERKNKPELIRALLKHGADTEARIEHSLPFTSDPFFARAIEDPPQVDPVGATPLLLAAASGDVQSMKILLETGKADKNARTIGGATLLMLAAGAGAERGSRKESEALEATKLAIAIGGDVNAHLTEKTLYGPAANKEDGRTAMHAAVYLQWPEMIKLLADHGADVNAKDRYGMTPMMIALEDPEALWYRQMGHGNSDMRMREPPVQDQKIIDTLLAVGAEPFTGTFEIKSRE
jgi:ankyrin repeat protein